jgi:hypothetical protein
LSDQFDFDVLDRHSAVQRSDQMNMIMPIMPVQAFSCAGPQSVSTCDDAHAPMENRKNDM